MPHFSDSLFLGKRLSIEDVVLNEHEVLLGEYVRILAFENLGVHPRTSDSDEALGDGTALKFLCFAISTKPHVGLHPALLVGLKVAGFSL